MLPKFDQHTARNGRQILSFSGAVVGSATSRRPDSPRWSELVVYLLTNGSYIRSKIGHSLVVHLQDCDRVNHWMTPWIDLEDRGERGSRKVPCIECQPVVRDAIDPHLMVEATRYTATVATDAKHLANMLLEGRTPEDAPRLVRAVIDQVQTNDPTFAAYLDLRYSSEISIPKP